MLWSVKGAFADSSAAVLSCASSFCSSYAAALPFLATKVFALPQRLIKPALVEAAAALAPAFVAAAASDIFALVASAATEVF